MDPRGYFPGFIFFLLCEPTELIGTNTLEETD